MAPNTSVNARNSSIGSGPRAARSAMAWKFRLSSTPATTPSAISPMFLILLMVRSLLQDDPAQRVECLAEVPEFKV